ncbi:MAG: SPOR domain-containing protein [Calditrichia bacterium]|nr:SPOR domain-containing protein [Calditrichia bacterium]
MKSLSKAIITLLMIISSIAGQSSKKVFMSADFNKMIKLYGKGNVKIKLPQKQILDSLKSRPYVWMDGYRIQLFASNDRHKVNDMKTNLSNQVEDSVYIIKDKALYRVQFGDYTDRIIAETKVDSMRKYGWPSAWIVTCRVKKFVDEKKKEVIKQPINNEMNILSEYYAIQVAAYSTIESAKFVKRKLQNKFSDVNVIEISGLYKVVVGKLPHRKDAESLLVAIKGTGYKDAWVTLVVE